MSLLTHNELIALVESGAIENVDHANINGASIDMKLADGFMLENESSAGVVDLGKKEVPSMRKAYGTLVLRPGEFALAATEQVFHLPDNIAAIYVLKSSMARSGLNHLNAGYCDPGWNGSSLTMEFHNVLRHHTLMIKPGDKAGQMYFFRGEMVPELASYAIRGQYNDIQGVQQSKGVR